MNENMMIADSPTVCDIGVKCKNDAHIMIYVNDQKWVGICDQCIDDIVQLNKMRRDAEKGIDIT